MYLEEKSMEKILEAPDKKPHRGLRAAAILELLYSTGIRVSELMGLNWEDVNFTE